ncbi:hypothetical protein HPP92_001276 [Vanilla planifolia]|uniref:Pentatricopeptide repeat-containing protein n=1 Tax=Vanilla planifolia TaxID=51239 RepID=A0A835VGW9_VANPL|nr:hypothetical protein HPP92_001276 [Vanilla planifolia]
MSFCRQLLLRSLRFTADETRPASIYSLSRPFAFSSFEEAAAERRRRKRLLRIEPPTRRDPPASRPPRNPNAPRLPDSTSSLVGPRLSLHNRVQTLIRSGDLDAASAQARHAVFSSIRPTVFTCNAVMSAMLRACRFDDVFALFHFFFSQQNIIPNIVSYNIQISAHCDAGDVDAALAVYRRVLTTAPFPASIFTYRYLVKGLVDSGRISEAVSLLREMLNRGHSSDSLVYNTVIAGFIDLGDMDKAIELFDELREHCPIYDGVVHATLMEGYWKQGMDKKAMDCYQSLLDRQFRMTPATCNVLLETLLKHDKLIEADKLFDHMLDEHKPPVFMGLNLETYKIMTNHFLQQERFAEAIEVFRRTGVKPLPKNVAAYNHIIQHLCENGMQTDAVNLFDEMLSQAIEPDAATYTCFADAFSNGSKFEVALMFLDKIANGGEAALTSAVTFCNKIFNGFVKAGCMGQAMQLFTKVAQSGIKLDAASYEILITGLCKETDLDNARTLFEEMLTRGMLSSVELQSCVLDKFRKAGRNTEIESLLAAASQASSAQRLPGDEAPTPISTQTIAGGKLPWANLQGSV